MLSFTFSEEVNRFRCGEEVLLLNSLTCTWARIHETEYKEIEALIENGVEKGTELPVKARQLLIDHILSVRGHTLELPQKELLEYLDHPRVVYYAVTNKCNLHCVYCYADGGCKARDELDTREALRLMEEVAGLGVETVVFTGGEPLLRDDLWDIVQEAHDQSMKTTLITNGTLITEDNVETITHQVDRVTVSLDSIDPCIHDALRGCETWERVIKSLLLLTQYRVPVDINITLTRGNQHTIVETLSYIAEHQLGTPKFSPYLMCGRGETQDFSPSVEKLREDFPHILYLLHESGLAPPLPEKRVRRIHCGMGHSEFGISADGRVYPCRLLQLPELCAGKVGSDSLHTMYYESRHFQMVRKVTKNYRISEKSGIRSVASLLEEAIRLQIIMGPLARKLSFMNFPEYVYLFNAENADAVYAEYRLDPRVIYNAQIAGYYNSLVISREKMDIEGEVIVEGLRSDYYASFAPDQSFEQALLKGLEKIETFSPSSHTPRGFIKSHWNESVKWDENDEKIFDYLKHYLRKKVGPLIKEQHMSKNIIIKIVIKIA